MNLCGVLNGTFQNLTFDGFHYGMFFGTGTGMTNSNVLVDNCTFTRCYEPLYMAHIENSSFSNLIISAKRQVGTNQWHGIYICHDSNDLTFENVDIKGGSGYCLQLWVDETSVNRLSFRNVKLDATGGRYPLVIGHDINDVTFDGLTLVGGPEGGHLVTWYGGDNVVIDGITASGGADLLGGSGDTPVSCAMKNGTYQGPAIGGRTGVTVGNVMVK